VVTNRDQYLPTLCHQRAGPIWRAVGQALLKMAAARAMASFSVVAPSAQLDDPDAAFEISMAIAGAAIAVDVDGRQMGLREP
jgi:hypothetical protein